MSFVARRLAAGAGLALCHSLRSRCDEQLVHVPSSMNLKLAGVIAEDALAEAHHVNLHPLAVVVLDAGGHDSDEMEVVNSDEETDQTDHTGHPQLGGAD